MLRRRFGLSVTRIHFLQRAAIEMGLYDREYFREEEPSGFQLRSPRNFVTLLIIANVVFWIADALLADGKNHWLTKHMAATSATITHPLDWWKFVTYGFAHSATNAMHLLGNMLGLWCFGRVVEEKYGKREFATFYLMSLTAVGLLWGLKHLLLQQPASIIGASGAVTATIILFVLNFPKERVLFGMVVPMPAWVMGLLLIAMDMFGTPPPTLFPGDKPVNVAFDAHLFGAALAGLYFFTGTRLSQWLPGVPGGLGKRVSHWSRPALRVHQADDEDESYQNMDDRADHILAKLHANGDSSLTAEERRILEAYSRRMRQKHR